MEKTQEAEHFHELLKGFETAVLVTHGPSGDLHSRPMVIAHIQEDCDVWFITSQHSLKVLEIELDSRAHIICQNGRSSCATITGRAHIVYDNVRIRELWKPAYRVWFPQGVEDPDIVLIKVSGEKGEYWDNTGINGIRYVYRSIKAVVMGTTPEVTEGEQHGRVNLAQG